jgi:hypothetical protein
VALNFQQWIQFISFIYFSFVGAAGIIHSIRRRVTLVIVASPFRDVFCLRGGQCHLSLRVGVDKITTGRAKETEEKGEPPLPGLLVVDQTSDGRATATGAFGSTALRPARPDASPVVFFLL